MLLLQTLLRSMGLQGFAIYLASMMRFAEPSDLSGLDKKSIEDKVKMAMRIAISIYAAIVEGTIPRDEAEILLNGLLEENRQWPTQVTFAANGKHYFFSVEEDKKVTKLMVSIVYAFLDRMSTPVRAAETA
jgi:hypothetical protein